ncbi:MAG TPA: hypothetical protein VLX92_11415 [Kofleriaceae bacterium]|nr:hypothetical protein [Kofleriaceae bacterium]
MRRALILLVAGCAGVHSDPSQVAYIAVNSGTDAPSACDEPEGPEHPYSKKSELDALVVGRWLHCSGGTFLPDEQAGIEFTADGTYYELGYQGTSLVRLDGFDHQGTWDSYQETSTSVEFAWHPTPSSGNGGAPEFEDNPGRLAIDIPYADEPSVYVLVP